MATHLGFRANAARQRTPCYIAQLPEELRIMIYSFLGLNSKIYEFNFAGVEIRGVESLKCHSVLTAARNRITCKGSGPSPQPAHAAVVCKPLLHLMSTNKAFESEIRGLLYRSTILAFVLGGGFNVARFFDRYPASCFAAFKTVVLGHSAFERPQPTFSFEFTYGRILRLLMRGVQSFERLLILMPVHTHRTPHSLNFIEAEMLANKLLRNTGLNTVDFVCKTGNIGTVHVVKGDGARLEEMEFAVQIFRISNSWLFPGVDPFDRDQVTAVTDRIRDANWFARWRYMPASRKN